MMAAIPDVHAESGLPARNGKDQSGNRPTVLIVAPPWPRSGTARVIQNQVDYYRHRGFQTLLVVVPFHWAYMNTSAIWNEITPGIQEFGADQSFIAALELRRYNLAKYLTSVRHGFQGTALDWIIGIGRSTRLPEAASKFLRETAVALLHVNHVYTLGFALKLRKKLKASGARIPIILDTHDVQAHLVLERGDLNPWTKKQDSLERLTRTEIRMLKNVDVLMHLSVDDMKLFQSHLPEKHHILSMPIIDESFVAKVKATSAPTEAIDILFVGQSHAPNLAAMKWFFTEVWPGIADRHYTLRIVGAVEMFVRESLPEIYEQFRSCFTGQVDDLAPYYRSARCVIAPMVSGSGISIKTIEALALGKPFVGTSKAYRGLPLVQVQAAGLETYDEPQQFADAISAALSSEASSSARSLAAYEVLFSSKAAFASRDSALDVVRKT